MAGINLLGHEENGNEKKREGAAGFELTHPDKGKSKPPVAREGALTYVREILDTHRPLEKPRRTEAKRTPLPDPKRKHSLSFFHHDAAKNAPNGNGNGIGSVDVNLILEHDDDDFSRIKRVRWLVIAFVGSLLLVGAAYAALLFYESRLIRETNSLDARIVEQQAEIRSFAAVRSRASAISRRVTAVTKLLDERPRWTNVFEIIEDYTLPTVYYSTIAATTEGSVTLTAFASDFEGVSDQLRVFERNADVFTSVRIQRAEATAVSRDVTHDDGTVETIAVPKVTFGIELTLDPKRLIERRP